MPTMTDAAPGTMDGQTGIELPDLDPVTVPPADEKPRRGRPRKTPAADTRPRAPRGAPRQPKLETRIGTSVTSIGVMVGAFHQGDGVAIVSGAAPFAEALAGLADESPKTRELLEKTLQGGAMLKVLTAAAAILLPIAVNHKMLPAAMLNALGQPAPDAPPGGEAYPRAA